MPSLEHLHTGHTFSPSCYAIPRSKSEPGWWTRHSRKCLFRTAGCKLSIHRHPDQCPNHLKGCSISCYALWLGGLHHFLTEAARRRPGGSPAQHGTSRPTFYNITLSIHRSPDQCPHLPKGSSTACYALRPGGLPPQRSPGLRAISPAKPGKRSPNGPARIHTVDQLCRSRWLANRTQSAPRLPGAPARKVVRKEPVPPLPKLPANQSCYPCCFALPRSTREKAH